MRTLNEEVLKKIEAANDKLENYVTIITGVAVNASKEGKALFLFESKLKEKLFPISGRGKISWVCIFNTKI